MRHHRPLFCALLLVLLGAAPAGDAARFDELAEQRQGKAFRLGEFHRRLLAEGPLPMSLLAEAMAE